MNSGISFLWFGAFVNWLYPTLNQISNWQPRIARFVSVRFDWGKCSHKIQGQVVNLLTKKFRNICNFYVFSYNQYLWKMYSKNTIFESSKGTWKRLGWLFFAPGQWLGHPCSKIIICSTFDLITWGTMVMN